MHYDPVAYVVLAPDDDRVFDWPEHPDGKIHFRTNNLGFREDAPTTVGHDTFRILVSGDSHTEGVVANEESLANVLERLLADAREADLAADSAAGRPVEVINAGVGVTGPDNYLGMLRKQLPLTPDLFLAVFFSGNDFMNALLVHDFRAKRQTSPRDPGYVQKIREAKARWTGKFPQGFNQAFYLHARPEDEAVALAAALEATDQMAALCREHGILFLTAMLPTKPDVDGDDDRDTCRAILDALGLTDADYAVNARLAAAFVAGLAERGIPCVDTTAAMRAAVAATGQPLYWKEDHHLGLAGHALVARELLPAVRDLMRGAAGAPSGGAPR